MSRLICVAALCLFAVGCSALNVQKPQATIRSMQVQNVTAQGFTMSFNVDLKNPNSIALPLTDADYSMKLAGVQALQGKIKPDGSLPANGSRQITLPVSVTYENLLALGQALGKTGDIPYAFDGGLSFNSGMPLLGELRVPLQYSGTLPLRQFLNNPQLLLQSDTVKKLAQQVLGGFWSR